MKAKAEAEAAAKANKQKCVLTLAHHIVQIYRIKMKVLFYIEHVLRVHKAPIPVSLELFNPLSHYNDAETDDEAYIAFGPSEVSNQ